MYSNATTATLLAAREFVEASCILGVVGSESEAEHIGLEWARAARLRHLVVVEQANQLGQFFPVTRKSKVSIPHEVGHLAKSRENSRWTSRRAAQKHFGESLQRRLAVLCGLSVMRRRPSTNAFIVCASLKPACNQKCCSSAERRNSCPAFSPSDSRRSSCIRWRVLDGHLVYEWLKTLNAKANGPRRAGHSLKSGRASGPVRQV